jgi:hypothetical protein
VLFTGCCSDTLYSIFANTTAAAHAHMPFYVAGWCVGTVLQRAIGFSVTFGVGILLSFLVSNIDGVANSCCA